MSELSAVDKRLPDQPPPRPAPNPLIGRRPEISQPIFGNPINWLRRKLSRSDDHASA